MSAQLKKIAEIVSAFKHNVETNRGFAIAVCETFGVKPEDSLEKKQEMFSTYFNTATLNKRVQEEVFLSNQTRMEGLMGDIEVWNASHDFKLSIEDALWLLAELSIYGALPYDALANMCKKHFMKGYDSYDYAMQNVAYVMGRELINFLSTNGWYQHKVTQNHPEGLAVNFSKFIIPNNLRREFSFAKNHLPMVVEPRKLVFNKKKWTYQDALGEGVFTRLAFNHEEIDPQFFNLLNRQKYQFNETALQFIVDNIESFLPDRNEGESDSLYEMKVKQFLHKWEQVHLLYSMYNYLGIKDFYILHQADERHRMYPKSSLLNPQGTDLDKAVICFEGEPLTDRGFINAAVAVLGVLNLKVNGVSMDKMLPEARWELFKKEYLPMFYLPWEEFNLKVQDLAINDADSPACFYAMAVEYYHCLRAKEKGLPAIWRCITHSDATASGLQILSANTKDAVIAQLTNLLGGEVTDIYGFVRNGCEGTGEGKIPPGLYTRDGSWKPAVMTPVYGKGHLEDFFNGNEEHANIVKDFLQQFRPYQLTKELARMWDSGWTEYSWYLPDGVKVWSKVTDMVKTFGGKTRKGQRSTRWVERTEERLLTISVFGQDDPVEIVVNIGFLQNIPQEYSCELPPNIVHSEDAFILREMLRRMNYNPATYAWVTKLYLDKSRWTQEETPNRHMVRKMLKHGTQAEVYSSAIIDYIDESSIDLISDALMKELLDRVYGKPCQVAIIHDSFGVHPNYTDRLRETYQSLMIDLFNGRLLEKIQEDIQHATRRIPVRPASKEMLDKAMNSCQSLL